VRRFDPAATRRFAIKKRRAILAALILLGLIAVAGAGCSGAAHEQRPESRGTMVRTLPSHYMHPSPTPQLVGSVVPIKRSRGLLLMRNASVGPIAASREYLVWEAEAGEEGGTVLYERNLRTGGVRRLAVGPNSHYGLAIAGSRVFYATGIDQSKLVAVGTDGRRRGVLSRSLIAPFDVRGEYIAWAERDELHQRVVVENLRTGRQQVAMEVGCPVGQCYRIDRVTMADKGVVFDLGAISQGSSSLIVRRAFRAPRPESAKVPADQQPDLAESSAGPLYYWLMHGWMRWDFGQPRPHLTRLAPTSPWPLDDEGGRLLLLAGGPCSQRGLVRLPDRRKIRLPAPMRTPVSPRDFGPLCRNLTGFSWTGNRLLLAWSFVPRATSESHSDVGLAGMVTVAHIPR
jgi:hypothetical protein